MIAVSPIVPRVIVLPIVGETLLASLVRSATSAVAGAEFSDSEDLSKVDDESTKPKKRKVMKVYGHREIPLCPKRSPQRFTPR
ncbi:hypothetical protein R1flu_016177 [Riccia fluitans]|uniref:Secreted protein n=1 Tax=Riccia fluitans TaxID=41844 RepID=A0ABD1YLK1_9MARC